MTMDAQTNLNGIRMTPSIKENRCTGLILSEDVFWLITEEKRICNNGKIVFGHGVVIGSQCGTCFAGCQAGER